MVTLCQKDDLFTAVCGLTGWYEWYKICNIVIPWPMGVLRSKIKRGYKIHIICIRIHIICMDTKHATAMIRTHIMHVGPDLGSNMFAILQTLCIQSVKLLGSG